MASGAKKTNIPPLGASAVKPVGDGDRRAYAGRVRRQAAGQRVAAVANPHRAEIHRQHVERGFGGALHGGGESPWNESTPKVFMVSIIMALAPEPDRVSSVPWAWRPPNAHPSPQRHQVAQTGHGDIHRPAGAKDADGGEHRQQVGNDADRRFKTLPRPSMKLSDIHRTAVRHQQEHHDEPDDHQVAEQAGLALQFVGAEGGEPSDQRQHQGQNNPHEGQHHGVGEFYALHPRGDQQARQVEQLVAIRMGMNTAAGSWRPAARGTAGWSRERVTAEVLSTRNRIWALVATAGVGLSDCKSFIALIPSGVAALSRPRILAARLRVMDEIAGACRHLRHQPVNRATAAAPARRRARWPPHRDNAQPQGHQPDQADRQLHRQACHLEQGSDHALEHGGIAQAQPLVESADEGDDKNPARCGAASDSL